VYIGAAYFFTSSTSFANPAIAVGRMLSDTFAGIAPSSVPFFVLAELGGGLVGLVLLRALFPSFSAAAARSVTLPHDAEKGVDLPVIESI
jgi:arsenate reductase